LELGCFFGPAKAAEMEVMTNKAIVGMMATEEIYSDILEYICKAARVITGLVELEDGNGCHF
jgi:hypothetical protein